MSPVNFSAEAAIRAWINARPELTGDDGALPNGAFLRDQRSPDSGAYAVISRTPEGGAPDPEAEDGAFSLARIQVMVFAGEETVAETAAMAVRTAFETLTGCPETCGDTGVIIRVADNQNGPFYVPGTSEPYCFQVGSDFLLTS